MLQFSRILKKDRKQLLKQMLLAGQQAQSYPSMDLMDNYNHVPIYPRGYLQPS
jgi:hypothetical protein